MAATAAPGSTTGRRDGTVTVTTKVAGLKHDACARVRRQRHMAGGGDRRADDHPAEPLVVGGKIGAAAAEADAQGGACGDHGQLVSERGVISISCITEPRGSATA